jgi:hypothetical protein
VIWSFIFVLKCFIIWYWTREVLLDGVGFGNDLTREWSFDQNVIHEHVLQIGIIA